MTKGTTALTILAICALSVAGQNPPPGAFTVLTGHASKREGFVPLYWDERAGKMYLEIDRFNQEMLYVTALSAGVGSNELGLDRGRMNQPKVVSFVRSGPRVLLVESNYNFRATSPDPAEQRSVHDSFARSVLWGFEVAGEESGHVLVDATNFLLRDAAGVANDLAEQKQGAYHVDPTRCAFEMSLTKTFPRNTEIETTITLTGEPQGKLIRSVTPTPEAVTVREHQAFVALPEPGYQPREFDPRAGFFSVDFMDFSAPVDQPVMKHLITRHRLEQGKPLVYYIDSGAPEPVRSALLEGASWWNQAFEAAGFPDGFQVKVLPPDADPMDVRYNVVQWVHRSTRGWSYGNSLMDPRTGEIVKGIVTLGSLRAHQDFLIFQGLIPAYTPGHDQTGLLTATVLARLRQLAAHEVGHTLGLAHNYIASTEGRASVMDYPGPFVKIRGDNSFDLSDAYAKGIGEWDKVAIRWGYGDNDHAQRDRILTDAAQHGLTFISDADSRPPGSAHPKAHLWDNGPNAVDELERILRVRQLALERFGENNIPPGAPMATLEEVLVPLYFLHRYQTEAAAKVLGGNEYTYAVRGDRQPVTKIVPAEEQRRALRALLQTLSPETLTIPERILALIPPRPPGYERTRELFANRTGVTFDPIAAAESGAELTVSLLLNPERAVRLDQYHFRDGDNPSFTEVADALMDVGWPRSVPGGLAGMVTDARREVILRYMLRLAADPKLPNELRREARESLEPIKNTRDTISWAVIERFDKNPTGFVFSTEPAIPPGQPIGEDEPEF
ncbi:MAG TPA: zinc-dependent metalloprotease [Bryobacteraceae bacterium]|jgi:hypothetical protein|nr:zinc-dependent metalloprotease [Bryobacteraceae bacterium]